MRYFFISEKDVPVAVVFHDYKDGTCVCRTNRESFFKSFELLRSLIWSKTVKERLDGSEIVRLVSLTANDYDWIDSVLSSCCGGFWSVKEEGTCLNSEEIIDEIVSSFLV